MPLGARAIVIGFARLDRQLAPSPPFLHDARSQSRTARAVYVRVPLQRFGPARIADDEYARYSERRLNEPAGLLIADGILYITDVVAHAVRRVDASGMISTIAGVPGAAGFSGDGGPATDAVLNRPVALARTLDSRQLFISNQGNDRVRAIDLASGSIRTFAGTGSRSWSGSRRLAGETSLFSPAGLDASANGFLFIADGGHSVVWRTSVGAN